MKSKILSNLFDEKYGFKLGEFNNTNGTERVTKISDIWQVNRKSQKWQQKMWLPSTFTQVRFLLISEFLIHIFLSNTLIV